LSALPLAVELKDLDHLLVPVVHHDASPFVSEFGEA
jgi:hypothetical protein